MIVFDLKCSHGHVFEAWFRSSAAWEAQRADGLVPCPVCGDCDVAKAVMAPNVSAKGNRAEPARPPVPAGPAAGDAPMLPPEAVKAVIAAVAAAQARALERSTWVGMAFADRARAMHAGDEPEAPIHGQATPEQAREMLEEGLPVAPLLVPVVPPEALN